MHCHYLPDWESPSKIIRLKTQTKSGCRTIQESIRCKLQSALAPKSTWGSYLPSLKANNNEYWVSDLLPSIQSVKKFIFLILQPQDLHHTMFPYVNFTSTPARSSWDRSCFSGPIALRTSFSKHKPRVIRSILHLKGTGVQFCSYQAASMVHICYRTQDWNMELFVRAAYVT